MRLAIGSRPAWHDFSIHLGRRVRFIDRGGAIGTITNGRRDLPRPSAEGQCPADAAVAVSAASQQCPEDQTRRIEHPTDGKKRKGMLWRKENNHHAGEQARRPDHDEEGSHATDSIQALPCGFLRWWNIEHERQSLGG